MSRATEPPLWALVGETPLVEIARLNPERARGVRVLAKLESRNPGGSVKDRAALAILRDALAREILPGRELLDATSGNTGIAYAMLAAPLGVRCHLVMPAGTVDAFLMETAQLLKTSFRIGHTTLQVETHPDNGCALAPDDVV